MNKVKNIMNLPEKMPLKQTNVDIEETDNAASRIHEPAADAPAEKATKSAKTARAVNPTSTRSSAAPRRDIRAADDESTTRITIDIPDSLYRAAKMRSFEEMITLKRYIVSLMAADLKA